MLISPLCFPRASTDRAGKLLQFPPAAEGEGIWLQEHVQGLPALEVEFQHLHAKLSLRTWGVTGMVWDVTGMSLEHCCVAG